MSKTEKPRAQIPLRQGDIVRIPDRLLARASSHGHEHVDGASTVIVASHDCDIEASAEKEPYIEVIPIELVERVSSQCGHTRNPRLLDVDATESARNLPQAIRLNATRKGWITKQSLSDVDLERPYSLDRRGLREFVDWLSARYKRAALPNEFGLRFKRVQEKFWNLLNEFNDCTSAVLLLFDEGQEKRECGPGESYIIDIYVVCPENEDDESARFIDLTQRMYDLFGVSSPEPTAYEVPDIEVRQCLVIREDEIRLKLYNEAIQLRSDWMSYKKEPPAPMIGS